MVSDYKRFYEKVVGHVKAVDDVSLMFIRVKLWESLGNPAVVNQPLEKQS